MINLYVEVADTPLKREMGLMGRKRLPRNGGMIFDFPNRVQQSFWMSNTYVPLDIAFINDDGTIFQIDEMVPLSTRAHRSKRPCRYALEVNRGWFKDNNLSVGSRIGGMYFSDFPKVAQVDMEGDVFQDQVVDPELAPEEVQPEEPSPDIMINKDRRQQLGEYMDRYDPPSLIIIYEKEDGFRLPPKQISPPYSLEESGDGESEALLRAWDDQEVKEKTFLIDNIISMEEVSQEIGI